MSVRVIAGEAKGRRLRVPDVAGLRPTGDRARETLFNILMPLLPGCRFLDVFAGSGAVGIEALSRGAASATFVERSRRAAACLRENLDLCGFAGRASVRSGDWRAALDELGAAGARFDVAFFDPPYDRTATADYLAALAATGLWVTGGVAVVEHRRGEELDPVAGWRLEREVKVGDTAFDFFAAEETADRG